MKPIVTEKAVMMIEAKNTLVFETEMRKTKTEIKKEFEELFNAVGKVANVNTLIKSNKKYAYIKLKPELPALDIATKLGLM